jgi:hypothetical protein
MNLSNDFLIRIVGAQDGFRVPVLKAKIEDTNMLMTIKLSGEHQSFCDVSRCEKLSAHFLTRVIPLSCPHLMYLDLSYTKTDDFTTVFSSCSHLKVLNISGCSLLIPSLSGIQQLTYLEVVSLRSSNIDDISALKELQCLRSLDLGVMSIKKVGKYAFENKNRIEELLLDECQFINNSAMNDMLDGIGYLSSLKFINLTKSSLEEKDVKEILSSSFTFSSSVYYDSIYYETKTRRELFFRAIIENNVQDAYYYLSSGQNITTKIEKSDEKWLSDIWIERCYYSKTRIQTPFFIFNPLNHDELSPTSPFKFFPNGLHLALFFNSYECCQMLLANGASLEENVYISDVLYEKTEKVLYEHYSLASSSTDPNNQTTKKSTSAFLLTSSKSIEGLRSKKGERGGGSGGGSGGDDIDDGTENFLSKKIYTIKEYIQYLYQKNVHRFTENLILKKVANWKSICDRYKKRLLYLIDIYDPSTANSNVSKLRGNDSFDVMSAEDMNNRKTFAVNYDYNNSRSQSMMVNGQETKQQESSIPIGQITTLNNDSPSKNSNNNKPPRNVSFAANNSISIIENRTISHDEKDINSVNFDNFSPSQLPILQAINEHGITTATANDTSFIDTSNNTMNEDGDILTGSNRPKILAAKAKLFSWKQHGLVNKVIGTPRKYVIPKEENKEKEDEIDSWVLSSPSSTQEDRKKMLVKQLSTTLGAPSPPPKQPPKARRLTKLDKELAELADLTFKPAASSTSSSRSPSPVKNKKKSSSKFVKSDETTTEEDEKEEVEVLGKKSFWLEGKKRTIEEEVQKHEENEIYPSISHLPLLMKKKQFLQNLKYRLDKNINEAIMKSLK